MLREAGAGLGLLGRSKLPLKKRSFAVGSVLLLLLSVQNEGDMVASDGC
jgi:hypothetical protein